MSDTHTDTRSVDEHREHLREDIERVRCSGRPLLITENGRPEAVVMSIETFDRMVAEAEFVRHRGAIDESIDEIERGECEPLREFMRRFAAQRGINRGA